MLRFNLCPGLFKRIQPTLIRKVKSTHSELKPVPFISRFGTLANINEYPETYCGEEKHFTIGDMHGNALKMIYFLIMTQAIDMTPEDYQVIVKSYHEVEKGNLNAIFEYKTIIDKYAEKYTNNPPNNTLKLRFLGDMLADRGANDYLTLLNLTLLQNINYEIVLSNHDLEYLTHSEKEELNNLNGSTYLGKKFLNSLLQLKKFLNSQNIITAKDIHELEKHYKLHLKLLTYSLPKNDKQIHIYTHAPIDIRVIENIATCLGIDSTKIKNSRLELSNVIDQINLKFNRFAAKNKVHRLFNLLESGASSGKISYQYPFEQVIWNRYLNPDIVLRHNKANYIVEFLHGHTKKTGLNHYHTYDNVMGKGIMNDYGSFEIYRSNNI